MAITIRELIITATVTGQQTQGGQAAQAADGPRGADDKEALVQECVDQVMRILKEQQRR